MTEKQIKSEAFRRYPKSEGTKWARIVETERAIQRNAFMKGVRLGIKITKQETK